MGVQRQRTLASRNSPSRRRRLPYKLSLVVDLVRDFVMIRCDGVARRGRALLVLSGALLALAPSTRPVAAAEAHLPVLTNAQQVLDLGLEKVRRMSYPARVRGVVTLPTGGSTLAFVQDATAGIQISSTNPGINLEAGQLVEVNGL